ncbi:hypothetical protein OSB04_007128 [Centaurea solstitialis]|uniref:Polyprotein n=1 Tax=Centaurea solstitialis TaxID=347529 RepID=A0AA38U3V2_9ASTR|nr:hypothetical protein OSB04_007128 [Centaurea solstitialis]
MRGDWKAAKDILDNQEDLVRFSINGSNETSLHVAAYRGHTSFVKELVILMDNKDLELQNGDSNTALCLAAVAGHVAVAEIMVTKHDALLDIIGSQGMMPLHMAALSEKHDMVKYLYEKSERMTRGIWTDESRGSVLLACVEAELYDVAKQIVSDCPELAKSGGGTLLRVLARKPHMFKTKLPMTKKYVKEFGSDKHQALQLFRTIWEIIEKLSKAEISDILRGPADEEENLTTSNSSSQDTRVIVQNVQDAPFPTGIILDDSNYSLWSQLMEMRIGARNKSGFLTGATPKPTTDEKQIENWLIDNNRVKSWLIDSMSPPLIRRFIRLQTAKEIWEAVAKTFYDGTDETQLFELNRRSFTTRQNGRPLPTYYNELVSIFQEIDTRLTTHEETVAQTVSLNKTLARLRVHIFLAGLDPEFNQARGEILRKDPPLDLESCYAYIRKDQNQRHTMEEPKPESDGMVHVATRNRPTKGKHSNSKGTTFTCTHCGEEGHSKQRCYEIIGYPDWWDFTKKPRKKVSQATIAASNSEEPPTSIAAHTKTVDNSGMLNNNHVQNNSWIIDTGATDHMTNDSSKLASMNPPKQTSIHTANGGVAPVTGEGPAKVSNSMDLDTVLVVPSLSSNLLSVSQITKALNCYAIFSPNECFFQDMVTHRILGCGIRRGRLYYLEEHPHGQAFHTGINQANKMLAWLWHRRLGHLSFSYLRRLKPNLFLNVTDSDFKCGTCELAKNQRISYVSSNNKVLVPFMIIHSDVWGPAKIPTLNGSRYFVTFVDECTRMIWVSILKTKGEVYYAFKELHHIVKSQYRGDIQVLQSDNGGEYINHDMEQFCKDNFIRHQTSCAGTPQQNGLAERRNRQILEVVRASLFDMNVPREYWGEAVRSATYLINRTPSRVVDFKTPLQKLEELVKTSGEKTLNSNEENTHEIPDGNDRSTDEPSSEPHEPEIENLEPEIEDYEFESGEIDGGTRETLGNEHDNQHDNESDNMGGTRETQDSTTSVNNPVTIENPEVITTLNTPILQDATSGSVLQETNNPPEPRYPRRHNRGIPKKQYQPVLETKAKYPIGDYVSSHRLAKSHALLVDKLSTVAIPNDVQEALRDEKWKKAMNEEMEALQKNQTWELVSLPSGKKTVGCRWIYTVKLDSAGNIVRYKARLVAKGYTQKYGIDYGDTFAPVAKINTIRILISIAANRDWPLRQFDVKNAFLNGYLEEEVYMDPPPGTKCGEKVCKLKKALYGLKQSPRAWFGRFSNFMKKIGYKQSDADHTLFVKKNKEKVTALIVYVDDMVVTGDDLQEMSNLQTVLAAEFELKDLGHLKYFLGIEVARSKAGISMCQRKYVLDLLAETGMLNCRPVDTPIETNHKLTIHPDQVPTNKERYQRLVGKLIYLSHTRPDIAYAVSVVSRFMHAPSKDHMEAAYRILRYLKASPGKGLFFGKNQSNQVTGYTDADWSGDRMDGKSTSGYFTFVGGNLVTWRSKKQKVVARSSAEAEYRGMVHGVCELIWIKRILRDLGIDHPDPLSLRCDNEAAVKIANNPVQHDRTKHVEVDRHFIKDHLEKRTVELPHVASKDQLADMLTKAVCGRVFQSSLSKLGMIDIHSPP